MADMRMQATFMLSLAHFHRLFTLPTIAPVRGWGPGQGVQVSSRDLGAGDDETFLLLVTDLYLEATGGNCECLLEEEHADTGRYITRYRFHVMSGQKSVLSWTAGLKCGELAHHPMKHFRIRNADSSNGALSAVASGILVE